MHWQQKSRYHLESSAGYTVAKVYVHGQPVYEAWIAAKANGGRARRLGKSGTPEGAKRIAETHWNQNQTRRTTHA